MWGHRYPERDPCFGVGVGMFVRFQRGGMTLHITYIAESEFVRKPCHAIYNILLYI